MLTYKPAAQDGRGGNAQPAHLLADPLTAALFSAAFSTGLISDNCTASVIPPIYKRRHSTAAISVPPSGSGYPSCPTYASMLKKASYEPMSERHTTAHVADLPDLYKLPPSCTCRTYIHHGIDEHSCHMWYGCSYIPHRRSSPP